MRMKFGIGGGELALAQSELVLEPIRQAYPTCSAELVEAPDEALQTLLRSGAAQFTIQPLSRVPAAISPEYPIVACTKRLDPRFCLALPKGLRTLSHQKPIGCTCAHQKLQLQALYPKMQIELLQDGALPDLSDAGSYAALVLPVYRLQLLQQEQRISRIFSEDELLPAAGQGILAVRAHTGTDISALQLIHDADAACCAKAERAFVHAVSLHTAAPTAAYARLQDGLLVLTGLWAADDGSVLHKGDMFGRPEQAEVLGKLLAEHLLHF